MKVCKVIIAVALLAVSNRSFAQYQLVTSVVKKVIKAIDLKVQRMQNQTIWLQNAQKTIENELSKFKLDEISGWTEKQRSLYDGYYQELWKVKSTIAYYQRIKQLSQDQFALVREYQRAWRLLRSDQHFRSQELSEMSRVYVGILDASAKNLEQVLLIINPGQTQMTDQQRLEAINLACDRFDENFSDLKQYNTQNIMLSLHRSKGLHEINTIKKYYGIH